MQARQAEQRDRRAERETSCRRHDHDPFTRPLPDPVGYGTVPLAGFRVRALPGSAAEAEERQAEAATRRAITRAHEGRPPPPRKHPRWRQPVAACRASRPPIPPLCITLRSGVPSAAPSRHRLASRTAATRVLTVRRRSHRVRVLAMFYSSCFAIRVSALVLTDASPGRGASPTFSLPGKF